MAKILNKIIISVLLILSMQSVVLASGYVKPLTVHGPPIDHVSGYLPTIGSTEEHCIYEWGTGPEVTTIYFQDFDWDPQDSCLNVWFENALGNIIEDFNENWCGGHVAYRYISEPSWKFEKYGGIEYICFTYLNYYGEGSPSPISYYGYCTPIGAEGGEPGG